MLRYGLVVGARLSGLVWFLMVVCAPLSWTIGKALDMLLGHEQHVVFRRKQLKALVGIHGEGGASDQTREKLTTQETKIITGETFMELVISVHVTIIMRLNE